MPPLRSRHEHPRDVQALAGIFAVSGVVHLVRPETYEPLMPDLVPAHREVILASGVAELLCAAGLLHPRTRRLAGWASAAAAAGRLPRQPQDGRPTPAAPTRRALKAAAYGRLPLQLPMIRTAWKAAHPAAG